VLPAAAAPDGHEPESLSENEGEADYNPGIRELSGLGMGVFNQTHAAFEGRAGGPDAGFGFSLSRGRGPG
jgi:hypothetical protein